MFPPGNLQNIYRTKTFLAPSQAVATAQITSKICQG